MYNCVSSLQHRGGMHRPNVLWYCALSVIKTFSFAFIIHINTALVWGVYATNRRNRSPIHTGVVLKSYCTYLLWIEGLRPVVKSQFGVLCFCACDQGLSLLAWFITSFLINSRVFLSLRISVVVGRHLCLHLAVSVPVRARTCILIIHAFKNVRRPPCVLEPTSRLFLAKLSTLTTNMNRVGYYRKIRLINY